MFLIYLLASKNQHCRFVFQQVISTILVIGLGTPIFFAVVIPIGVLYYWIQVISLVTFSFTLKFLTIYF